MKILYIHQYFKTPYEPGGTRSYWISRELIDRGHQVTVVTSTSKNHPEAGRVQIDGIDVVYVNNPIYSNYLSSLKKAWIFIAFIRNAMKTAMKEKDVDLVFATSTPLTVGAIALWLKWRKRWKYVFEVRDLWPEFPIEIGAIRNGLAIWFLRKFEKRIYDKSEHVVALSPGMKDGVMKAGTPEEKVSMVPNMSKPDKFYPHEPNLEIAKQFGIDLTKFNVIHFGSMGKANGLEYIINAAKKLQDEGDDSVRFIFLGSGATEPVMKKLTEKYGLKNVSFHGSQKMDVLSEVVNCCQASITTFLNLPVLQTNSPNKLFDSLSAGKPIIVNSAGWTKDLVEKEICGFYANPETPADLVAKLQYYMKDKELLKTWGENARRLSLEVYDKAILSAQVADIIEKYGKA
jgi:glycosyltransferase involved in cell wall biosynthesis